MKRSVFRDDSSIEKRLKSENDDGQVDSMDLSDDEWIVEDDDIDMEIDHAEKFDDGAIGLKDVPCGVLLNILDFTDEFDFYNFSLVSKAIRHCLTTGKYTQVEEEGVRNRLREKMEALGRILRENPRRIADMTDPPEFLQLIAVRLHPDNIEYIKNPSEQVQRLAVSLKPWLVKHIKNPSDELQRIALENDPWAIEYIKNPSEEVQRLAVENNPWTICHITKPSEELAIIAIRSNPDTFEFIPRPSEEVTRIFVEARRNFKPLSDDDLLRIMVDPDYSKALRDDAAEEYDRRQNLK
jgi:hypothetical protein